MTDAIDMSAAVNAAPDCPDVRAWPIGVRLSHVSIADSRGRDRAPYEAGSLMVEFDGRDRLPEANSTQGAISYTVWLGCFINGAWHLAPVVECIRAYVPSGPFERPGQIANNLLYFIPGAMGHYQPKAGENIVLFVTTGDTRRQNAQGGPAWRSNAVLVPFQIGETTFEDVAQPPAAPPSLPPEAPPVVVPPTDLSGVFSRLESIDGRQNAFALALAQLARAIGENTEAIRAMPAAEPSPWTAPSIVKFPNYSGSVFGARVTLKPETT